jgi:hypothetical protein
MSEEVPPAQVVSGVGGIESEEAFGTPDLYETAREEWLIEGYSRALTRFRTATQKRDDPEFRKETFIPLFEALDFAASLIERVEPKSASEGKPTEESLSVMQGVRYVRNRLQHQWAVALRGRDVPQPVMVRASGGSRITGPPVVFDWFWKPLGELPSPDTGEDPLGRESYEKHLAEEPARLALDEIERALNERCGATG